MCAKINVCTIQVLQILKIHFYNISKAWMKAKSYFKIRYQDVNAQ